MKKTKRVLSLVLAFILSTTLLVGCGGGNEGTKPSIGNKTVLSIGNTDAGLTDVWLNAVAKEFEEMYSDWQGKDGKQGVHIEITNKRNDYSTSSLAQNMPYNGIDLYFMSECSYSVLVNANVLADLTDVITNDVYDANGEMTSSGASMSIEDKMANEFKDWYNVDGSYYALPFFATPVGITYDADLFDTKKLFLDANNVFNGTYADLSSGNCSSGPDGKKGTFDDGLPATWEEFKSLLSTMNERGVDPFMWDGVNRYQREYGYLQLFANYDGKNDFDLYLNLNGHSNSLNMDITKSNAYELMNQGGRQAALQAIHDICSGGYYSSDAGLPTTTHTNAQLLYVGSVQKSKRVAFILEGSWWENECRDNFERLGKINSDWGYGKRNFRLMPIPRFVGTEGIKDSLNTRHVLAMTTADNAAIVVSKNSANLDLAKEFIKFLHSRRGLALMSQQSSVLRPFEYDLTQEELNASTKYFQSIYEMWKSPDVDVVYTDKYCKDINNNQLYFGNGWVVCNPFKDFQNNKNLTANDYLNSLKKNYNKDNWIF